MRITFVAPKVTSILFPLKISLLDQTYKSPGHGTKGNYHLKENVLMYQQISPFHKYVAWKNISRSVTRLCLGLNGLITST